MEGGGTQPMEWRAFLGEGAGLKEAESRGGGGTPWNAYGMGRSLWEGVKLGLWNGRRV